MSTLERKFPIVDNKIHSNPRIDSGYVCSFRSQSGYGYDLHVVDQGMSEPSWVLVESDTDWSSGPMSVLLRCALTDGSPYDVYRYCIMCLSTFGSFSWKPLENP